MAPVFQEKPLKSKSPSRPPKQSVRQTADIKPYIGKSQMFCPVVGSAMSAEKRGWQLRSEAHNTKLQKYLANGKVQSSM